MSSIQKITGSEPGRTGLVSSGLGSHRGAGRSYEGVRSGKKILVRLVIRVTLVIRVGGGTLVICMKVR